MVNYCRCPKKRKVRRKATRKQRASGFYHGIQPKDLRIAGPQKGENRYAARTRLVKERNTRRTKQAREYKQWKNSPAHRKELEAIKQYKKSGKLGFSARWDKAFVGKLKAVKAAAKKRAGTHSFHN